MSRADQYDKDKVSMRVVQRYTKLKYHDLSAVTADLCNSANDARVARKYNKRSRLMSRAEMHAKHILN